MPSSVKTDLNFSISPLAFAQSDVAGKPKLVLRVGMPVSSPCKALIYDQLDLELSFRLAATNFRYVGTVTLANIQFHL